MLTPLLLCAFHGLVLTRKVGDRPHKKGRKRAHDMECPHLPEPVSPVSTRKSYCYYYCHCRCDCQHCHATSAAAEHVQATAGVCICNSVPCKPLCLFCRDNFVILFLPNVTDSELQRDQDLAQLSLDQPGIITDGVSHAKLPLSLPPFLFLAHLAATAAGMLPQDIKVIWSRQANHVRSQNQPIPLPSMSMRSSLSHD